MQIIAHRGLDNENNFPENSFLAIKSCLTSGWGLETDLRLDADKEFVLIHDRNLKRLFGKDIQVETISSKDIKKYKYLSFPSQNLTFLEEIVSLFRGDKSLNIALHLKYEDQTVESFKLLREYFQRYNLYDKAFIFDLTMESARQMKKIDPQISLSFIVSEYKFDQGVYLWEEVKEKLPLFDIVWLAEYKNLYSEEFFSLLKASGKKIYAVSPELHRTLGHPKALSGYEEVWKKLIDSGVEAICTDYPHKFLSFYEKTKHFGSN